MGVNLNIYTVYGIETEDKRELYATVWDSGPGEERFDEFGGEAGGIIFGETYIVFGVILYKSTDFRWDWPSDWSDKYSFDDLLDREAEFRKRFKKFYPEFEHLIEGQFKLFTFPHYS
jgi:hypothetical protein